MIPNKRDRVGEVIAPLGWVLQPLGCVLFCATGWLISYLFSHEAIGMAYIWLGIGSIIFCIQLERPWLNTLPFPPLTTLVVTINLRGIIGGLILMQSRNNEFSSILARHIVDALPLIFIPSTCLVLLGWAINSRYVKKKGAS